MSHSKIIFRGRMVKGRVERVEVVAVVASVTVDTVDSVDNIADGKMSNPWSHPTTAILEQ